MTAVVPRWEWRTFDDQFGGAQAHLQEVAPERDEESDELYLLSVESDASAKVRNGRMDVKRLLATDDAGLEQWKPVIKESFPLPAAVAQEVAQALGADITIDRAEYGLEDLGRLLGPAGVRAVRIHKHRTHYTIDGCMVELTEVRAAGETTRTVAVEAEDRARVAAVVQKLGLAEMPVICMARGLKALLGRL